MNPNEMKDLEHWMDKLSETMDNSTLAYELRTQLMNSKEIDLTKMEVSGFRKMPELTDEFLKQFGEWMKSNDNWYISSYFLDGTVVKPIQYEPLKILFKSSGKVVLENDLREFFTELESNFDGPKWIIDLMTGYSKEKFLHGYVGNSCPTFWISDDNKEIVVGTKYKSDEHSDEPDMNGYSEWGYVCTDLWWYSLVDYEVLKEITGYSDEQMNESFECIDMPEGTWELEHYYGITKSDHNDHPYAKLTKIN